MSYDPEKLQDAIDLSHHLSRLSRARAESPLKGLQRYFNKPGMISLAGGLPSPVLFPFSSVSGEILVPDSFPLQYPKPSYSSFSGEILVPDLHSPKPSSSFAWLWKLFGSGTKERTSTVSVDKYPANPGDLNLATALQYGLATGLPDLQTFFKEFTTKVYQPGYKNFSTLVHAGNTDGWGKAVSTLCNPGEGVLTEEWTYPSAMASMMPNQIRPVAVAIDGQGMRSDALRTVLSEWDEGKRGMPRPRVLYTIPVGQNPTGATMLAPRKKEIYDVCVEYDIVIVEDDPYFILQEGPYIPKADRASSPPTFSQSDSDDAFIASLAPSYLKFDYQGRVIRLDTFSKTIAPGCRLGWFTCNPMFAERLERQGEVSTQNPCGFGQVFVTSLLLNWQFSGYIRWLKALRIQYAQRRDFFIDCLMDDLDLQLVTGTTGFRQNSVVYEGALKQKRTMFGGNEKRLVLLSLIPPSSGMFVWIKMHFESHPSYSSAGYKVLEEKLWIMLAEAGVLFGPGNIFSSTPVTDDTRGDGHFRISFSNSEFGDLKKAVSIFAKVLAKFMSETVTIR